MGELTSVPGAPPDIVGVRNLRGKIITVIDMAIHLGVSSEPRTADNRLILLEHHGDQYGFLVDNVYEAVILSEEEIMPPTGNLDSQFSLRLRGLWRFGNDTAAILNPEKLFCWQAETEVSI